MRNCSNSNLCSRVTETKPNTDDIAICLLPLFLLRSTLLNLPPTLNMEEDGGELQGRTRPSAKESLYTFTLSRHLLLVGSAKDKNDKAQGKHSDNVSAGCHSDNVSAGCHSDRVSCLPRAGPEGETGTPPWSHWTCSTALRTSSSVCVQDKYMGVLLATLEYSGCSL